MKSTGKKAWYVGKDAVLSLNWLKSQFAGSKNVHFSWRVLGSEASPMLKSCLWLVLCLKKGFVTEEQSEKLLGGGAETILL